MERVIFRRAHMHQLKENRTMSSVHPVKKGNALEDAVHLIEQTILSNNPATRDAVIMIEPKKIVIVDGVKHEIDIIVTIDMVRVTNLYSFLSVKIGKNQLEKMK